MFNFALHAFLLIRINRSHMQYFVLYGRKQSFLIMLAYMKEPVLALRRLLHAGVICRLYRWASGGEHDDVEERANAAAFHWRPLHHC
jgi:hypothetical protein